MANRYAEIAFTQQVLEQQEQQGSRKAYEAMVEGETRHHEITNLVAQFIADCDSFYMASVSETGWPYMQHRGGPKGFLRLLDRNRLGFADFRGNRQYISLGNLQKNDRVSLFIMDYLNRRRLKIFGRTRVIAEEETDLLARLAVPGYRAKVERGIEITVEAFDWNCPQHITPRVPLPQVEEAIQLLRQRIAELEQQLSDQEP